ncbi:DNA helicase II [Ascidiaceihabitans donghaensis]|uniref:DNA 3'-5' helicase II n=1 Tax=Ascidiaceihabitans donghaensis TaxID=1510460 RepID=A0A2R8BDA0_9RHOB|nr:ATP-dependent helicase [Ascidiaceihabitans donghaensis]SPH21023.1 DNA helicase II [Ascidiaceihabitans donghaensis]
MIDLSQQQREIIEAPLKPMAVTACAGSGKTSTAVRRLAAMRKRLDDRHGHMALLSFSNVAVDTFNKDYNALLQEEAGDRRMRGIEIATVDAFITSNIIRPHGHLAMGCNRTPFLVHGSEPFLTSFTVWDGKRRQPTTELQINPKEGVGLQFEVGQAKTVVDRKAANQAIKKLAQVGAYSHALGSLWALQVLRTQPLISRALVRRYPHILVDEAQDIGMLHQLILMALQGVGAQISLIGDVNQGIYEFSGATGAFLEGYADRDGVEGRMLETNFRSVPSIVTIANKLSGRDDKPERTEPETLSGAYYFAYKKEEKDNVLKSFAALLGEAGIAVSDAAVLCRSAKWADDWGGGEEEQGQGVLRKFVSAAIQRDKFGCFDDAFKHCCAGVVGLLDDDHGDVLSDLVRGGGDVRSSQMLRRKLWTFVKDATSGLPSASLVAGTAWQPTLLARMGVLLDTLSVDHGLEARGNWKAKLARRKIFNRPLIQAADLGGEDLPKFRVSTVHKVKGESIKGVMYICNRSHLDELLGGTTTEVGKIGYVALTRARDLFVLGVPATNMGEFAPKLDALGFKKAGAS